MNGGTPATPPRRPPPELPRLLYLSDVNVESSHSGSLLLYRLLETFPSDRLLVIETTHGLSKPERRLPGVNYACITVGGSRLSHTRLHRWWSLWQTTRSRSWARRVLGAAAGFEPDAVLTVAHGHAWLAAAAFARWKGLPLHLIVHDDWPRMVNLPWPFSNRVDRQFGPIYRVAASRLCVSPWMVEAYRQRYGAEGRLLYPSRARDALAFSEPPQRLRQPGLGLVVALAGTIRAPEHFRLLGTVARLLRTSGGRVLVFGPTTERHAAAAGLCEANVEFPGLLDSRSLIDRLRAEVDVLLLPASFAAVDAANMEVYFPSKLTDYTAAGLPLLVCGPAYSSAVRWAKTYPGVAEVVESPEPGPLLAALNRLATEPELRVQLARRALEVGDRLFSHHSAWDVFADALAGQGTPESASR